MAKMFFRLKSILTRTLPVLLVAAYFLLPGLIDNNSNRLALGSTRGKVEGRIFDAESKDPLIGVNVIIEGTGFGASTDINGEYFIANVNAGSYTIKAMMIGYSTVTVQEVRVVPDITTSIDIEMSMSSIEMQEVVKIAERPVIEMDKTASSRTLSNRELTDQPSSTFNDVLQTLPSIDFENGEMRFRGRDISEVSFLIDGMRVQNPMDKTPFTNYNLSAIQEVEVITGSFNAEYGQAMSGVVNVITKEGSENLEAFLDVRYVPPGVKHWGPGLYDRQTDQYWENSYARHQEWWIENTDQWVDPAGNYGYEADCQWTPEEAYQYYLDTHKPLTDYDQRPSYQTEFSIGGSIPIGNGVHFFATGRHRSQAPLLGNSYLQKGLFYDGTLKLTYHLTPKLKISVAGLYSEQESDWAIDPPINTWWTSDYSVDSRYALFDYYGIAVDTTGKPANSTAGQSILITRIIDSKSMVYLRLGRVVSIRSQGVYPDDPTGWEALEAETDYLRGYETYFDSTNQEWVNVPAPGGYANRIGYNTIGYYSRYFDRNEEWSIEGYYSNQLNKHWHSKTGFQFEYDILDHFNQAKFPDRLDDRIYRPYQGALYAQNKLEFGGFIMNAGFRFDFSNLNDSVYTNTFDPFASGVEKTKTFMQLSPRLGVSHPIDDRTMLRFSYGHFFQRQSFGDYGEGNLDSEKEGSITTFIVEESGFPYLLGNRQLRPMKTVAYEVGFKRNIADLFLLDLTAYYMDIRNTVKPQAVQTTLGGTYSTNRNGNYADSRGFEAALRLLPTRTRVGEFSGYISYTKRFDISGKSGAAVVIREDGSNTYASSGDDINYNNPLMKFSLNYTTPENLAFPASLLSRINMSVNHYANYPNEKLLGDIYISEGKRYLRPPDQETDLRMYKAVTVAGVTFSPYLEVQNLFNSKWVNIDQLRN
ncbi:MAG: TonB-dependent receptor, partial [Candidatus Marinimicrobia bacterium]|nr:TonB-dependent receptor [Candidatus Neomarinimicrobiota bacterium]